LQEFARAHDIILFVGGTKSSNARVLYNHCLEANFSTIFVSNAEEVLNKLFSFLQAKGMPHDKASLQQSNLNIGICGATSTPLWLMQKVKDTLIH
jgi:4-hydroxy-3-methylbut-2-enyl diphosphate reductase